MTFNQQIHINILSVTFVIDRLYSDYDFLLSCTIKANMFFGQRNTSFMN